MNYDLIFSSQNKGLKRNFLVQKLKRTIDLPVLPDILNNLDRMLSNPDVTVQQISELINADPVIAGRVLNMANSAYYCAGRKIVSNIDLAVSRLGFKVIRALVYSAVLPDLFKEITELDHLQFWKHSMTVALLSRYLIESEDGYKIEDADRAYLCGLMHDIGILVFYSILGDKYSELIQSNQEDGWGLHRIEEDEFVLNHADVGSLFVDLHWEVDPKIVDVIKDHHRLSSLENENNKIERAVFVANCVCNLYKIPNGVHMNYSNENIPMLLTLADLDYDEEKVGKLLEIARDNVSMLSSLFNN